MDRAAAEKAVLGLAARQHGVFTDRQALAHGLTRDILSRRVLAGRLVRPHPGVYLVPGTPRTLETTALAAAWSFERGVVTEATAARLWAFPGASRGRIEVAVPRGRAQARSFVVRQRAWLPEADTTRLGVVPITTRERTLVDLAGRWSSEALVAAADDALAADQIRLARLGRTALPLLGRGHVGSADIVRYLDDRAEGPVPPASELERQLDAVLAGGSWGRVLRQAPLPLLGGGRALVDLHLVDLDLVVEADGRRWHTRVADFARDRRRDRELGVRGLFVARFTSEDLRFEPEVVRAVLEGHRRRASGAAWPIEPPSVDRGPIRRPA